MWIDRSLEGKRVLITAGADGIGLEIAKAFDEAGARIAICDISDAALERMRSSMPHICAFKADVAQEANVEALFAKVDSALGGLDVLVNNAGIAGPTGRTDTLSLADWERTLAVNLTGQFLCARAAIPRLIKGKKPAIVNLSSIAGHIGVAGRTPYAASKWAVVGFTKSLALELGAEGIRVNTVLPGIVQGPRIDSVIAAKANMHGESIENMTRLYTQHVSLGRMVCARDIANMVRFACSDQAANVHGQELVVDGYTQAVY